MAKIPNGYKKTEIGVIPEDWNVTKLQDISTVISSKRIYFSEYKKQGVPFYRSKEIIEKANGKKIESEIYISEERFNNIKDTYGVPSSGDILVSSVGTLGVTYLVNNETFYFKDGNLIWLKNIRESEPLYILYQTKSSNFKSQIDKSTGGSSQSALTIIKLKEFFLPLPSHSEQVLIAHTLSDIDSLITSLEKLINKKKMIRQGVMQELLTGKRRVAGFSGEWKSKSIEDLEKEKLVRLCRGNVISKTDIAKTQGEYPIYSSSIHNQGLFGRYGKYMFDEELITWSVDGGGDFFYRSKHKYSVTNVCGYMRVNTSSIDYYFLALQLQLLHSKKNFDYQMKAHPSIIRKAYIVSLPSLEEQKCIALLLHDKEKEISMLDLKLYKLKQIKQGAMQQLLTGKIRLINK